MRRHWLNIVSSIVALFAWSVVLSLAAGLLVLVRWMAGMMQ